MYDEPEDTTGIDGEKRRLKAEVKALKARLADIQDEYAQLLDALPLYVYAEDVNDGFRHVRANAICGELWGIPAAGVIGKADEELFSDSEQIKAFRAADVEAARSGELRVQDMPFTGVDGKRRIGRFLRKGIRLSSGRHWVYGVVTDITDAVESERKIGELNAKLERSIAHKRFRYDALSFLHEHPDVDEFIEFVAERLLALSKCDRVSVGGSDGSCKTWTKKGLTLEDCQCFSKCPLCPLNAQLPGEPRVISVPDVRGDPRLVFPDGCLAKSVVSFRVQEEGRPWRQLMLHYMAENHRADEYELRTLETVANLIATALERQRLVEAQRDFFVSVSHDIRTPLNSIIGFTELIKGETDPDVRKDYLDNISFSGNTLLELVDDVLDLARIDAGKRTFVRTPCDLKHEVQLILRTFETAAGEKNLELKSDIGELPVLELDEHRVRQVLFNLVGNAVKYTDEGGVTVSASFERTDSARGRLRVSVRDTGIGIAPEDVSRLMKPYVRLQVSNARGGTGLGLSICKRIVESAGGEISISSELGRGSVFAVLVPDVPYRDAAPPACAQASSAPEHPVRDFSALRALVVDDLEMNRRVLAAGCRRLGVGMAAEAASSAEALDLLAGERFDIVLADMKMPGMDGGEFIRAVRKDPALADLPVVLVTADVSARGYYKDLGAEDVLLKPVVLSRLAETISGVCVGGRADL
ncbi:MAG: response regulator [Kiritimatiellae bacterium]|nr:response regulator [Kiritimatiellia bacterium]